MIHAVRSERPGQRFAPLEPRHREGQHKHIHLHLHVHLTFRVHQGRSCHPDATRLTRIFAALVTTTATAFSLLLLVPTNGGASPLLFTFAWLSIYAGLVCAWSAVVLAGIPLLISAWRSVPRLRLLLVLPFIPLFLIALLILGGPQNPPWWSVIGAVLDMTPLGMLLQSYHRLTTVILLFYAYPFLSVVILNRAIGQAEIATRWLRFARWLSFIVVAGMALVLLGTIVLALLRVVPGWYQAGYPWYVELLLLLGMCLAVIVAVRTLFSPSRHSSGASPKDASPSEVALSQEPRGYQE